LLWADAAVGADLGLTFFTSNQEALVTLDGGTGRWHRIEASANLLQTIGAAWQSTALTSQGAGVYLGTVPVPSPGWTGFFVELTYPGSGAPPLKFSTQVYVVPDVLPYHYPP
jgi:hypothetical protein